jgi:hypothetical protein
LICLVRGLIFGTLDISRAAELSSKTLQYISEEDITFMPLSFSSSNKYIIDLTKRVASESATNPLSAVERDMMVCILDCQCRGASEKNTMYPDQDLAVSGLSEAS